MKEWVTIRCGRRANDAWCAISEESQRLCFQTPVDYGFGKELEVLPKDKFLRRNGVVVWDQKWGTFYIVARHAGWTPGDYFIHAARLLGERVINEQGAQNGN